MKYSPPRIVTLKLKVIRVHSTTCLAPAGDGVQHRVDRGEGGAARPDRGQGGEPLERVGDVQAVRQEAAEEDVVAECQDEGTVRSACCMKTTDTSQYVA